jgi:hypothetical protein
MTKTSTPLHPTIKGFTLEWKDFNNNLPKDLQQDFQSLMKHASKHPRRDPEGIPFQQIIMSILIEHEKEINRLGNKLCQNFREDSYPF